MLKEAETRTVGISKVAEDQAAGSNSSEATAPEGDIVTVKGREFYCQFLDGGKQIKCTSVEGEEVQLRPPENGYFYSVAIKQLTNGSES